ncbi:MAG TPA: alpha/beta hydrolase [Nitrolancea sp.]|nr:alpha/beta hydrolase [Nitrolancea sp.]
MALARVNGVDIFYEEAGAGPPVVFSHEFAGDAQSWAPQVHAFSRLYRCLTYNHRGFPPSSVPDDPAAYSQDLLVEDLRGLLDTLGIERAHLVGLSMGGNVVLNFALRYPERCHGVVVAGCGAGTTNRERFERDIEQIVDILATRGMAAFAETYSQGATRLPFRRKDPAGWQVFRERLAEHSARGMMLTQLGVQRLRPTVYQLEEHLRQLRVPALILIGDEDEPCVDPAVFMKRVIPSAGLVVIPQSGHTINLEEPARFNDAVLDFLRLVEAGRWPVRQQVTTSLLPPG